MRLSDELFGFQRLETNGERLYFKVFELFIAVAVLHLAWTWASYIPRISDVVLPLGIAQYIDIGFMFGDTMAFANAGVITALAFLGYFRAWRWSYAVAFLLLHLQYAARFSLGEIPHSSNLIGMCLLGLAIAMPAFDAPSDRSRFALGFTYFYAGIAYTLSGISKLVGTGLSWADGRHLWMWVNEKGVDVMSKYGVLEPNMLQELTLASLTFATLVLTFGMITELSAFLMWFRKLRIPVILAVLALHVGIDLIMSIFFYLSVMLLVIIGFPWAKWIDRLLENPAAQRALRPLLEAAKRFA